MHEGESHAIRAHASPPIAIIILVLVFGEKHKWMINNY